MRIMKVQILEMVQMGLVEEELAGQEMVGQVSW
jgi:uncharacterized protein (DUF433 family)